MKIMIYPFFPPSFPWLICSCSVWGLKMHTAEGLLTSWAAWFVPALEQPVKISWDKWQSGWEMHCRRVLAAAKIFARSQDENPVAEDFSSWRKMILTSDLFVMAHKSGISVNNLLLARRRQRDEILITNMFINGCRDMIGRKSFHF